MRLLLVILLVYLVLSSIFYYHKNRIDNPPPNTLSYYVKKSRNGPLTDRDLKEMQKIMSKVDKLVELVKVQNRTLDQQAKEQQVVHFEILAIFSIVFFFIQYLTWEYSREQFLHIAGLGVIFIISGIFLAHLSEEKIAEVLLLKPCRLYLDTALGIYAQRPITHIAIGYILIFNTMVCFIIDRVLVAKEIKSMFTTRE